MADNKEFLEASVAAAMATLKFIGESEDAPSTSAAIVMMKGDESLSGSVAFRVSCKTAEDALKLFAEGMISFGAAAGNDSLLDAYVTARNTLDRTFNEISEYKVEKNRDETAP